MKKFAVLLVFAAALGLISLGPVQAGDSQTLPGEYYWDQGGTGGELEAVFTPTGDDTWDVAFHFTFDGQDHIYKGTAKGSLKEGALEGEVKADQRPVTFTFEGTFSEGKFSGTHAQIREGGETRTGTLTLGG